MNANVQPPTFDTEKRIGQYVGLRDKIADIEAQQKEQLKPYKETLEKLGAVIMRHLQDTNQESASTAAGTAYLTPRKSASLEDPDAFMRFVIANEAWDLLDRKANSTAVEDFVSEHKTAPPGVKFSQMIKIGVRRK